MIRLLTLMLAVGNFLFLLLPLRAQTAQPVTPAVIAETTASGVRYLRIPMPEAPTQSLQLLWQDSSPQATGARAGLPMAAQYLMAREPAGERLGELIETLRDYQGGFNVSVGTDAVGFSLGSPKEHFVPVAAIASRFLNRPALPQDRLDTYRRDAALEAARVLKQGQVLAGQIRTTALLPPGSLRNHHLIDPLRLEGVTAAHVAAWHSTLARDRLTIVTAGPLGPSELDGPVSELVAHLPATADIRLKEPVRLRAPLKTIVLEAKVPQTIIQAFGPTTIVSGPEAIKANMAVARLGGGAQGRLHAVLRDQLGATYGASVNIDTLAWGLAGVSLQTAVEHDKAVAALAALRSEYARWWLDGVTEAEFAAVRSSMIGGRGASRLNPNTVAITAINAIARGWPQDYFAVYDRELEAITRPQVNAYIRERFPKDLGIIIVAPSSQEFQADCVVKRLTELSRCGL